MKGKTIAFVSVHDPSDIHSWSGIPLYMSRALERVGYEVVRLGPLACELSLLGKIKKYIYPRLIGQRYLLYVDPSVIENYAKQIRRRIESIHADVVVSPGSHTVAGLESTVPVMFWTDATFELLLNYYPEYTNLCTESICNGHDIERAALERAGAAVYTSEWAADSAMRFYGGSDKCVHVVPFGANIEGQQLTEKAVRAAIKSRPRDCCRLLFVGVDWSRKRGSLACAITEKLNERGFPTELHIIGCEPQLEPSVRRFVHSHGFVSKETDEGSRLYSELLFSSHFLVVPSRAEAYGFVFCEASAYGLPSVTTATGGISTIVHNGVNGHAFPLHAPVEEYCSYIEALMRDRDAYEELAISAFREYQTRLNWDVAGNTVRHVIDRLL